MAANLQRRAFTSVGKRLIERDWSGSVRDLSPASAGRRGKHVSAYDKNPDEHVRPVVVPDHVIEPQSDKYWAPHPNTGVFGPTDKNAALSGGDGLSGPVAANGSVLEEKVWFRPQEDVEKPQCS